MVRAQVPIKPCGPACLLAACESFIYALPGGMALRSRAISGNTLEAVLFATGHGTLVKTKSVLRPSIGRNPQFAEDSHQKAIEILRRDGLAGVSRPMRECDCSWEFQQMQGRLAWTSFSLHAPWIAELFPVHALHNRQEAVDFVRAAWQLLSELNKSGITHGDPTFYNFLIGDRVSLIDLDECVYTGQGESVWDQSVFLYATAVPVLGKFMAAEELALTVQVVLGDAAIVRDHGTTALIPAIAQAIEHNRVARLARSLSMLNRALEVQLTETGMKLHARLAEERENTRSMHRVAEERARALEEAHAEMDQLGRAAAERLTLIRQQDRTVTEMRGQLERAVGNVENHHRSSEMLPEDMGGQLDEAVKTITGLREKFAAAERSMSEKEEVIRRIDCDRKQLTTEVESLRARIRTLEAEGWRDYIRRRSGRNRQNVQSPK